MKTFKLITLIVTVCIGLALNAEPLYIPKTSPIHLEKYTLKTGEICYEIVDGDTQILIGNGTKKPYIISDESIKKVVKETASLSPQESSSFVQATNTIAFTEHPVELHLGGTGSQLSCSGDWPATKCVFVRGVVNGNYTVAGNIHMMGYGTWPTTNFHAIMWYVNGIYFINVIYTESAI